MTFAAGKNNIVHEIAYDVLLKAYGKMGIRPKIIYQPLEKSLQLSNAGATDGELCRIKNIPELYPNLINIPVVINYVEGISFTKNRSLEIRNWEDLRPYKLAIIKGAKFIETATADMDRVIVETFLDAFELLNQDSVEIVVAPKTTGVNILLVHGYSDIRPTGSVLQKLELYHFLHKKNKKYIPEITMILQSMQKTGEIDYIRFRYLQKLFERRRNSTLQTSAE
jgi:hypothetical protein